MRLQPVDAEGRGTKVVTNAFGSSGPCREYDALWATLTGEEVSHLKTAKSMNQRENTP